MICVVMEMCSNRPVESAPMSVMDWVQVVAVTVLTLACVACAGVAVVGLLKEIIKDNR